MLTPSWLNEPSRAEKHIIFARHGEYECNVRKVCNCDPRTPYHLTEKGQAQAVALGERLSGLGVEAIVSSEFLRARQTAALANRALGNLPILVNSLANENRVGSALENKQSSLFLDLIRDNPTRAAAWDGENFLSFKARVQKLLDDLLLSSPEVILIVAHGWTLQVVRALLGLIRDEDAAMCVGMPKNCEVVSGWYSAAGFSLLPSQARAA